MAEPKVILSLMFFTMSFAFYFLTAAFYIIYWLLKKDFFGQTATALAYIALFSTLGVLVSRAGEARHAPFANLFESMILFLFLMTIGWLWMERRHKVKELGAIVMPIAFAAIVAASLLPYRFKSAEPLNPALQSKWKWLVGLLKPMGLENYAIGWLDFHVFTTFVSYAAFAIAFGLSIVYLIREQRERKNKKSALLERFPSSDILDELSYRMIAWGFPFLAVGIVTGAIWANYAWGTYWSWDPKETWSLITWLIYGAYIHARVTRGWRGRKSAYLSIIGFLSVVFLYWGVSFVLSGLHAYA